MLGNNERPDQSDRRRLGKHLPMSNTLLIQNARLVATMDDDHREINGGGMFIRDGWIERIGPSSELPDHADQVVDLDGHLVLPGLINTHHHLTQSLDRASPASQNESLTGWLRGLYPRWLSMTPADMELASEIGLVELALSGCTTVADHQYLWPQGFNAGNQFEIATRIGVRFHLGRGSQNIGVANGGFAPQKLIEDDDQILAHTAEIIDRYHDPAPGSFRQVFVAPSSLRAATPQLMRRSAELAAARGVLLHFHLGETESEVAFTLERFGKRPAAIADELGCLTPRTWLAHAVHFAEQDIEIIGRCGCGICHCPSSNMRLASGIAPVARYLDNGLTVGLGVDGSASNDSSNLLVEMRQALLLSRVSATATTNYLNARTVLAMATCNGARLLGRADIGVLAPGRAADFIAIDGERLEILGSDDPLAALVFCALTRVDHSWVQGRRLVEDGQLVGYDFATLVERCRRRAKL